MEGGREVCSMDVSWKRRYLGVPATAQHSTSKAGQHQWLLRRMRADDDYDSMLIGMAEPLNTY